MCAAKQVALEFSLRRIVSESVCQTSDVRQCFACKKGKKYVRPIVQCELKHRFVPSLGAKEYVCFACIEGPFGKPKIMLNQARQEHARSINRKSYPLVFELCERTGEDAKTSSAIATFFDLHASGNHVAPHIARDAMNALLVYQKDPELLRGLVWLDKNKARIANNPSLQGLRPKFEGIGSAWPTVEERRRVASCITHHTLSADSMEM